MGNKTSSTEKQYIEELKSIKEIKTFSYEGLKVHVKVYSVYDGDTCNVIFKDTLDKDSQFKRIRCRMAHYDSAEIKGKSDKEKKLAISARDYLSERVLGKIVYVHFQKNDKWGRPIIEMYMKKGDQLSINQLMIKNGYGKPYEGGKKEEW